MTTLGDILNPPAPPAMQGDGVIRPRAEKVSTLRQVLNGLPEVGDKLALLNEFLNPLAAIPRAQQASQEIFAPNRTASQRVASLGNMLSETAGVVAPVGLARATGTPAINALAEGMTGMTAQADNALDVGRRFAADESGNVALPFARGGDAPETRAQTILDMLQSGRAGEITDEMLDLGDPTANARLNQYLYRNYDLPMDEASRMQRAGEMGFDTGTPLYHGTRKDFAQFDQKKVDTGAGYSHGRTWATTEPKVADAFSKKNGKFPKSATLPVVARGDLFDVKRYFEYGKGGGPVFNGPIPDGATQEVMDIGPALFRFKDNVMDMSGGKNVRFQMAREPNASEVSDVYAITDPANIRSRFARFDPRLSHLRNLSASGVSALPLGALLASQYDQENQQRPLRDYLEQ